MWKATLVIVLVCVGCERGAGEAPKAAAEQQPAAAPFEVRTATTDLVFTYFDDKGAHAAQSIDAVPESARAFVRVDSLKRDPASLDPSKVFVVDLRSTDPEGRYPVKQVSRERVDLHIDGLTGDTLAESDTQAADADVIIYGAAWCGACRKTARYLRSRGVAFVEKDIEKDAQAAQEMQSKAKAAGVKTTGIPVIDFKGKIINGFDERALDALVTSS